jgi:hypothetical protein
VSVRDLARGGFCRALASSIIARNSSASQLTVAFPGLGRRHLHGNIDQAEEARFKFPRKRAID